MGLPAFGVLNLGSPNTRHSQTEHLKLDNLLVIGSPTEEIITSIPTFTGNQICGAVS